MCCISVQHLWPIYRGPQIFKNTQEVTYFCIEPKSVTAMDRKMSGRGGGSVVVVLVALVVLTNCVDAQIYQCWGGCYNECFLLSTKSRPEKLVCYLQCLSGCVPGSPSDFRRSCQIGCSMQQCTLIPYNDGARMEKCFGRCSNLCKV